MIQKTLFGITIASIMVLGGFSFSSSLLPEADAAAFAKYDGIDGESTDSNHEGWNDVLSFGFGVEQGSGTTSTGDYRESSAP